MTLHGVRPQPVWSSPTVCAVPRPSQEVRVSLSYSHSIRFAARKKTHHLLDPFDPLRATLPTFDILRFVRTLDHDLVEYDDRFPRPADRQRLGEGVVQPLRGGSGAGGG